MDTQHVHAGWLQKAHRLYYDDLSCHIPAPWMT